jgi:predicted small integral membrane protein
MEIGWFALCFFAGVFFGVFVTALARMASLETPSPEAAPLGDSEVAQSPAPMRRTG